MTFDWTISVSTILAGIGALTALIGAGWGMFRRVCDRLRTIQQEATAAAAAARAAAEAAATHAAETTRRIAELRDDLVEIRQVLMRRSERTEGR